MKLRCLGDFVELRQGLAINKGSAHLVSDIQDITYCYPLLRIADMMDSNFSKFVSKDVNSSVIANPQDIIYTRTGQIGLAFRGMQGVVHNNSFIVSLKTDELEKDYLYTVLNSNFVKKQANSQAKNSVQPDLTHTMFKSMVIPVPDSKKEQNRISKIINNINQKIQINNQINQELEAMAKTLYDYWFVQFDFPDQNGKPYKSSGGKMVYNPELKREIPEGWGVEKLSEFLVLNKDKYNKELNWQKIHYLETSNLIENKIEKLKKLDIKSDKIPSRAKEIVKDRDILYSLVRPNQMHFGFIRNPIQNLVASTGFVLLSCEDNPIYNIFFYLFMTLPNNVRRMIKLSESSTSSYPSIRPEDILNMEIVTPYDFSNYRSLVEYLDKIYYQIDVLYKQNQELTQLRDWLLPMLMNGQVKVEVE